MDTQNWLTEQFELQRPHLESVAYRMLGSLGEAEDAVQESWLRLNRADTGEVENLGAWLTTVVGRVCLDMLRARRSRREEYVESGLPEPIVSIDEDGGPEQQAILADSVGVALLVVLDMLTPAERLAFVLHDMFDVPFDDLAPIVGRSPAATRQLASRARRRVRGQAPTTDAGLARQREVVEAFLAAARGGDFDALLEVLDPDVVFRVDAGGSTGVHPVKGAPAVARRVLARGAPLAPLAQPAIVNGEAGAVVILGGRLRAVVAFTVVGGRVAELDVIADVDKLQRAVAEGLSEE